MEKLDGGVVVPFLPQQPLPGQVAAGFQTPLKLREISVSHGV